MHRLLTNRIHINKNLLSGKIRVGRIVKNSYGKRYAQDTSVDAERPFGWTRTEWTLIRFQFEQRISLSGIGR